MFVTCLPSREVIMTGSNARERLNHATLATMLNGGAILLADTACASQGPGGGMGTASPLMQLLMAVIVYGTAGVIVVAGLIGAVRGR